MFAMESLLKKIYAKLILYHKDFSGKVQETLQGKRYRKTQGK
jgi:hypothetical protein